MPQYVNLNTLKSAHQAFVRPLTAPMPRSAVGLTPSPHQFYLSLPKDQIPPNVRVQNFIDNRSMWTGINKVDKFGGRKTKDEGKDWREGAGRQARKRGGLKWALRER